MSKPQTLYRMYDRDNVLLYVGITQQQVVRFYQHARSKAWWPEVERIRLEHYATRADVEQAERDAIQQEGPRYNVIWNDTTAQRSRSISRDGYGFGLNSGGVWRPEALECALIRKGGTNRSSLEPLVLWWELDHEMISDDYLPQEADAYELFDEWVRIVKRKGADSSTRLPIWWFVVGPHTCEYAFRDDDLPHSPYFDKYFWLRDASGCIPLEIDALPVAEKAWRVGQADKGGFIQQAAQWHPSPLEQTVTLGMLQRRVMARHG